MLNRGVLVIDANGRIATTANAPTAFNAGVGVDAAGALSIEAAAAASYVNGMPFTAAGKLAVESAAPVGFAPGGLPITAAGRVALTDGGAIVGYNAGLPYTAGGGLVTSGGAYLPSDNPASLVAWFRKGVGVTITGSGVSQWADQSGNARHLLQATDAARPAYNAGAGIITFDGVADLLRCAPFVLNRPAQVSVLCSLITYVNNRRLLDGDVVNSSGLVEIGATNQLSIHGGIQGPINSDLVIGAFTAITIENKVVTNTTSLKVGNAAETVGECGSNTMGGFVLGAAGNLALFANVAVKEVIIRNVDNATIRAADHAYLQTL